MFRKYLSGLVLLATFVCFNTFAFADNEDPQVGTAAKGTFLKAVLVDSTSKAPVEFATMSAKYIGEQTAKKYALSDNNGVVIIQGLRVGRATVNVEFMGYKTKTITFDVKRGANDMGQVLMQEDINLLDAVVVTDKANQMVIKKDTLEYNASSFKTNESDMLEELLKKLPGIEISTDGSITANGKTINKIMIDGKTFFLDDPQLATKNLPAKIVDKVRVVERKSDQARFTGIDDGEEETVIDLGIKKGMMNGWFGNLSGGYGTKERYQAAGMAGHFTDKTQVSVLANANNTNNRGFMDVAGSMMGSMRGGGGMGRGGGAGMFRNNGITESWMGGVNANTEALKGKMEIGGNYLYSGSESEVTEKKNKETFLNDGVSLYNYENGYDLTRTDGHRIGVEMDYNISDNTSILFRPTFNFNSGDYDSFNEFNTVRGKDSTNRGTSRNFGENESQQFGGRLLFRQRLGKPGRTVSLMLNYNISNNETDGYNKSTTYYFNDNVVDEANTNRIDQFYNQSEKSYTLAGRISYTEPLGKNYFLEGAYRYSYKKTNSDKDTYDWNEANQMYDIPDNEYSTHYENIFITQQAALNLMKQEDKYNFTVGVSMQPSTTESLGRNNKDTTYSVINFAPAARFDYRFSDDKFLRLTYRGRTSQPSISQLMPINDNSDPLRVTEGNPDLNPEFSHNLGIEYRTNNRKNFSWFSVMADASYTTDKIVNRITYDENGVQYTRPYNDGTGVYSASARIMFNTPIAKSNFSVMSFGHIRFGNSISYVADGQDDAGAIRYSKNITQSLSINENLRFTYRNDFIEVMGGGRVGYQDAWYSVNSMDKVATWTNAITGSVNATIPGGVNITTDINHTFYIGYGEGYGETTTIWNAEISKTLFKNQVTLKAKIYDILKDARNTYRTTTENYIQDVENNTLGQYVMVSLVWRFGKFSGGGPGMGRGRMGGHGGGPGRGPGFGPRR